MNIYVNAGFGEMITAAWWPKIKSIANGIRQDIPSGMHATAVHRLVKNCADAGSRGNFLINGWLWSDTDGSNIHQDKKRKPTPGHCHDLAREVIWASIEFGVPTILEVGNEINIDPVYKRDRIHLSECVSAVWSAIRSAGKKDEIPLIAASVSNVERDDGMRYLTSWLPEVNSNFWAGVHPYRTQQRPYEFTGYASEEDFISEFLALLGDRPFAVTEAGWHNAKQESKRFGQTQFSMKSTSDFCHDDISIWSAMGAELYTHYQIRDGAGDDVESRFGAFTDDGDPKLIANTLRTWKDRA